MPRKKKSVRRRLITIGVVLLLLVCYWAFSNYTFVVTQNVFQSEKIQEMVRIALISDLHGASYGTENGYLINMIRTKNPDLIIVTGDLYNEDDSNSISVGCSLLKELVKDYPVYYVCGETDCDSAVTAKLLDEGIKVLNNTYTPIKIGTAKITLYGIHPDKEDTLEDTISEFGDVGTETYNIVISHKAYPEEYAKWGVDLSLSGSTHGGIVHLPLWGPVYYEGEWTPKVNGRTDIYDRGTFQIGETALYVSSGLGNYPYPLRWLNRPELSMIEIQPAS